MEEEEGDKANTPPPPTTVDGGGSGDISFGLPDEVLRVLPQDPFAQLDVARRITSIALSTRVSALESEAVELREHLEDRDALVGSLRSRIESLDAALTEAGDKLAAADAQKEALLRENSTLSNTVKKLNRDVSKLEVFKKTLMRSLQDDEDASGGGAKLQSAASEAPGNAGFSSTQSLDDDSAKPSSTYSSMRSQISESVTPSAEDHQFDGARLRISHGLLSASQTSTPRFTPPGSPPASSASASPTKTSKPSSPRRHSVSFATSRGMFDMSSFPHSSRDSISSYDGSSQTARTRVDGKEFFRQVRSRLSYEQFGAFLSNVKQLNSHKQTKEETLRKADEIFGAENKDLYTIFEGLLSRNYP